EDGIRDPLVTGVQTCALPISSPSVPPGAVLVTMASDRQTVTAHVGHRIQIALREQYKWQLDQPDGVVLTRPVQNYLLVRGTQGRSEERRVGKGWRCRRWWVE